MNRERKLFKNTIIISIGKICTQFVSFLLLPLYTGYLSTTEYGIVDLVNTLVTLLMPIVSFQLYQGVFRELIDSRNNEENKGKIISTGTTLTTMQCIIFLILFLVFSPFINNDYKLLLVVNLIICIYLTLFQQIARGFGDNTRYSIGCVIASLCTIVLNVFFIVGLHLGATGMLLGTMLGQLIGIIYFICSLKLIRYIGFNKYDVSIRKKLLKYSIPLIPNAISWWLISASDAMIVSLMLGVDMNGVLAASLKFSTILTVLYGMFDMAWIESISANINDKDIDVYFNKTMNIILKLFLSLCIGIIACMPFVFPIMINSAYSAGYVLIPFTILSALFNVIQGMVIVVFAAKKNTGFVSITSGLAAIINIAIDILLIKFIGLYAAVISTLIAYIVIAITRYIGVNKKYFKIKIEKALCLSGFAINFGNKLLLHK